MKRGDLVTVVMPGELGKPRPAVIVQDDRFMSPSALVVVPFTSHLEDAPSLRIRIEPDRGNGLRAASDVMIDKVSAVPRGRIGPVIGELAAASLRDIGRALALLQGLAPSLPPAPP